MDKCLEHSGCIAQINSLKDENDKQWEEISKVDDKVDKIMSKLNIVLVSVIIACIGLFANLITDFIKVN